MTADVRKNLHIDFVTASIWSSWTCVQKFLPIGIQCNYISGYTKGTWYVTTYELHSPELRPSPEIPEKMAAKVNTFTIA